MSDDEIPTTIRYSARVRFMLISGGITVSGPERPSQDAAALDIPYAYAEFQAIMPEVSLSPEANHVQSIEEAVVEQRYHGFEE